MVFLINFISKNIGVFLKFYVKIDSVFKLNFSYVDFDKTFQRNTVYTSDFLYKFLENSSKILNFNEKIKVKNTGLQSSTKILDFEFLLCSFLQYFCGRKDRAWKSFFNDFQDILRE